MSTKVTSFKIDQSETDYEVMASEVMSAGGAPVNYTVHDNREGTMRQIASLDFQQVSTPGLTNEMLLSIVAHRLESLQIGPFPCTQNDSALYHVNCALNELKSRTIARRYRGVEGKLEK